MKKLLFIFLLFPFIISAQVVEEKIQIDTTYETIKVIYKPTVNTTYYQKKTAVFASDTSQIAIEKSYTNKGKSGLYKVYYPSGRLKIKTVFANNRINGEWTYYDKNGIIIIKGNYKKGVKNGYWAYKSLKTYGYYYKGLKIYKWHTINNNKKKEKSFYKKGVLVKGKGYGNETISTRINTSNVIKPNPEDNTQISQEHQQAISFLTSNTVFKKALKEHFSNGKLKEIRKLKKHFIRDKFQFVIAPYTTNLDILSFIKDSENGHLTVAVIDSILKSDSKKIEASFKSDETRENRNLYSNSTNRSSPMSVYFSNIHQNLLRIDVVNFDEVIAENDFEKKYKKATKSQKFQLLLYFNDKRILKGAEYEKP